MSMPFDTGVPALNIMGAIFRNILDDYQHRGVCSKAYQGTPPAYMRGLPASERAKMEREELSRDAAAFLDTPAFDNYCQIAGLDPVWMRRAIHDDVF